MTLELGSPRLTLRSIRESDEELYCELFCDAETMRYIGPPWTRAEAAQAFRGVLAATRDTPTRALFLVMIPKTARRPIGLCSLQNFDHAGRSTEMGVMVSSQVRAQGIASEALIALIAHAFAALPFDEVWVRIAVDHIACQRTAEIIGLVQHTDVSPQDLAANVRRWSAYRGTWSWSRIRTGGARRSQQPREKENDGSHRFPGAARTERPVTPRPDPGAGAGARRERH